MVRIPTKVERSLWWWRDQRNPRGSVMVLSGKHKIYYGCHLSPTHLEQTIVQGSWAKTWVTNSSDWRSSNLLQYPLCVLSWFSGSSFLSLSCLSSSLVLFWPKRAWFSMLLHLAVKPYRLFSQTEPASTWSFTLSRSSWIKPHSCSGEQLLQKRIPWVSSFYSSCVLKKVTRAMYGEYTILVATLEVISWSATFGINTRRCRQVSGSQYPLGAGSCSRGV